jgi:hypothetical protein
MNSVVFCDSCRNYMVYTKLSQEYFICDYCGSIMSRINKEEELQQLDFEFLELQKDKNSDIFYLESKYKELEEDNISLLTTIGDKEDRIKILQDENSDLCSDLRYCKDEYKELEEISSSLFTIIGNREDSIKYLQDMINMIQDENIKLIKEIEILGEISGICTRETTGIICYNCNCYMKEL